MIVVLLLVGAVAAFVARRLWRSRTPAPVVTITRAPAARLRLRSARRETL